MKNALIALLLIHLSNRRFIDSREAIGGHCSRGGFLFMHRLLNGNPLCHWLHIRLELFFGMGRHNYNGTGTIAGRNEAREARPL